MQLLRRVIRGSRGKLKGSDKQQELCFGKDLRMIFLTLISQKAVLKPGQIKSINPPRM